MRFLMSAFGVLIAATLGAGVFAHAVRADAARGSLDCEQLDCGSLLPGAVRFEAATGGPYVIGRDSDGTLVGWLALSTDVVDIMGYSGKPLVTLVSVTPEGVIGGARVVSHSEPILLVGIPESALDKFVAFYAGKRVDTKIEVGTSSDPDTLSIDAISGATVTVLAENRTILETARTLGAAVGVLDLAQRTQGHFVHREETWTWARMVEENVFGRLTVGERQMGLESDGTFIDLYFTLANPPQVGKALLGPHEYAWHMKNLAPGEYLLAVFGNGSSSFKGSGFVRGGMFDRVRIEQGLFTTMFTDKDYTNLSGANVDDAPSFKESALFVVRAGKLDPGEPFDLVFLGSRYDRKGGFSRDFRAFPATLELPSSVYRSERTSGQAAVWRAAWQRHGYTVLVLGAYLLFVVGLFARRRWLTGRMSRLKNVHLAVLTASFVGMGIGLGVQPSVTQVLTLVGSTVDEWRWELFLSEPFIFLSWIFIAVVTLVWGRGVFCGWVCPYGAMTELLNRVGQWLKIPQFELSDRLHTKLRYLRYVVLALLVVSFLFSTELGERLAEVEPFKTTFLVAPWTREWYFVAWWALLLLASFAWYRPFCRYLCPLGAALALPSSMRISGPYRRDFCQSCKICTRGCEPRAIDDQGRIDPRECLSCMECEANFNDQQVCPPLIGLERLTAKSRRRGLAPEDEARRERLRAQATPVTRFAPPLSGEKPPTQSAASLSEEE